MEFLFHSAEEETSEDTNRSNCLLCGFDHLSGECPNTVRVCKYCGGVGHPHGGIKHHRKVCCFCGINHSVLTECQIKWYEPFPDDFTISKEDCDSLPQEITQKTEEDLCQLCKARPVIIHGMCNYCNNLI